MIRYTVKEMRRPVARSEKITDEGGNVTGSRSVTYGYETADVLIEIDSDAIARELGPKAMRNSSGKSIGLGGHVTVKVVSGTRKIMETKKT